jgi:hypothetical protein
MLNHGVSRWYIWKMQTDTGIYNDAANGNRGGGGFSKNYIRLQTDGRLKSRDGGPAN